MLTTEEIHFLRKQGLSPEDVFDSRNIKRAEAGRKAKQLGKRVLIGTPCNKAGHRLRTRAGHCIQCDTSKIAHSGRNSTPSDIYLAYSAQIRLVKFGISTDAHKRVESLCSQSYANASDWKIVCVRRVKAAEKVESKLKAKLRAAAVTREYRKDGAMQHASECFDLPIPEAIQAFEAAIEDHGQSIDQRFFRSDIYHANYTPV